MQFNSFEFIFYFLPPALAVYYIFPKNARPAILTLESLVFYWFATGGNILAMAVLLSLSLAVYCAGLYMSAHSRSHVHVLMILLLIGTLAFFKLYDGGSWLPVGMSFYVFQLIAYVADVHRSRVGEERNLLRFAAQVTMFPKLLSGPLAEPAELSRQTRRQHRTLYTFHLGLQELILGLAMKVILANRVGGLFAQAGVVGFDSVSTPYAWLALVSFCMKLYFDFYGYSLMAVGLGHMFGYHLPMNFLEPYSARSVSEFYRRWHATLGRWFREYVYIPLGGNRRGAARTVLNLFVVWLLTGVWHGIGGTYLIWAGILFLLIVNERLWLRRQLEKTKVLCHIYTVLVILLSWVPFASADMPTMVMFYRRLFGIGAALSDGSDFITWGREYAGLLISGLVLATPIPKKLWQRFSRHWLADAVLFVLFWVSLYYIATMAQDPFAYFRF